MFKLVGTHWHRQILKDPKSNYPCNDCKEYNFVQILFFRKL